MPAIQKSIKVSPLPSQRWRHHTDIVGNARQWLELLADLPDAALAARMEQVDPRENVYVVSITQSPAGAVSETSRAVSLSEALLRFGNERLCEAWLLPSLETGHDKAAILGEALKLCRYDWFARVRDCIEKKDHAALGTSGGAHGPLFYWACSMPPAAEVSAYNVALDDVLRLPPYENRRAKVNAALLEAFQIAVQEGNTIALDLLCKRGVQPEFEHVVRALATASPASLEWLLENDHQSLLETLVGTDGLSAQECGAALRKAAEFEEPCAEGFDRIVRVMRILVSIPQWGEQMLSELPLGEDHPHWNKECEAARLSIHTPAVNQAGRALRM